MPLDISLGDCGGWCYTWAAPPVVAGGGGDAGDDNNIRGASVGEEVALQGRDWALRALRKEDMQVYMFRLLLEWARLIDDRREELAFE